MVTVKGKPICDYMVLIIGPNGSERLECEGDATHRVYWPGKGERDLCPFHAKQLTKITRGMGFGEKIVELTKPGR